MVDEQPPGAQSTSPDAADASAAPKRRGASRPAGPPAPLAEAGDGQPVKKAAKKATKKAAKKAVAAEAGDVEGAPEAADAAKAAKKATKKAAKKTAKK